MIKVRLSRHGSKKRPYYHLVVTDGERPRDGRFIEQVGTYDPKKPMEEARIDHSRVEYWVGHGAQPTPIAKKVLREHKKALDAAQKGA
jgi:small subunit ribosomal protein S16